MLAPLGVKPAQAGDHAWVDELEDVLSPGNVGIGEGQPGPAR